MKNRFYVILFILSSIIFISILPIYNFFQFKEKIDFKELFNTDYIEKELNYRVYKIFNRSMDQEQVITGKDDFLFLGNFHHDIVHKTNGIFKLSDSEIENWLEKVKSIQDWYEKQGIKFLIVVAPNKQTIYSEKLPNWVNYSEKTITDDIVNIAQIMGINIFDLKEVLKKEKNKDLLYWKTDSHWNEKAGKIAYINTLKYLNDEFDLNLQIENIDLVKNKRGAGDLTKLLKFQDKMKKNHEIDYRFKFQNSENICIGDINKDTHALEKCKEMSNRKLYINSQPKYIINKYSKNDSKLLFLCDSFGSAPSIFYNASFKSVYQINWAQITGEKLSKFVKDNQPDIVIYQIVERALYNNDIITPIF